MNRALLVLPLVILSLLAAIWSGWIRIGFSLPLTQVAAQHGSIMINGFLSTVIFLERAVTFKNRWVLLLPFVNASSIIFMFIGEPILVQYLHIICSFAFLLLCAYFIYKYKEVYYYVFFAGAFSLLTANIVLHQTQLYPAAVTWWMNFLLFTIVAERLELSRFLPLSMSKKRLLIAALAAVLVSCFVPYHSVGKIAFAISLSFTAMWLLRYDMAFKSIRAKGQHRYSGVLLITGYAWLFITAVLILTEEQFAFGYDAVLHSFFIGFVFSMIFSHAPIILPAVAKLPIKIYKPVLYVWFLLMQVSLIVRIVADVIAEPVLRKYAGFINGISMLLFFVTIAATVFSELAKRKRRSAKS